MNAVNIVHKGSKVHDLQVLAMSIFNICSENNITIFVRWIPREYNDKDETLSRIVDTDDSYKTCGAFLQSTDLRILKIQNCTGLIRFIGIPNQKVLTHLLVIGLMKTIGSCLQFL